MYRYLALEISLISFFFLRGGQLLFNRFSANWAYVFDQLGLALVGTLLAVIWLKSKHSFKLSWFIVVGISALVIATHYRSFYRPIIYDEWNNVISSLNILHDRQANPEQLPFFATRERYAWAPFTAIYEIYGIDKPYSAEVMSAFTILMILGAALAGAWLAYVISGNKIAALIAGLLIGISPNSFASLPWPSSTQGESLGIILTSLTVGVWIVARQTKDPKGILLALLLLAATLKGGGSVRTITVGSLLIMSDIILFSKDIRKRWFIEWLAVLVVGIFYFFSNSGVHVGSFRESVPFLVRAAQMMELTSKSFIPPTLLAWLMEYLIAFNASFKWVVVLGALIFTLGWGLVLLLIVKGKLRIFTWGWMWFYLTVFFTVWFGEEFGSTLESINDRYVFNMLRAGYKYAYLPLVGMHVAIGAILGSLIIHKFTWRKLFFIITILIIGFRSYEFLKLDYHWRVEHSIPNREWQKALFKIIPRSSTNPSNPKVLVLVDGKHNPMFSPAYSAINGMYYDKSVIYFGNVDDFYNEAVIKDNIPPERVFALGWDSGKQKIVDLTFVFRKWLQDPDTVSWRVDDFRNWSSNTSPELNVFLPNPNNISLKLDILVEDLSDEILKDDFFTAAILCNSDHGKANVKKLVNNQMTLADQLGKSRVEIPLSGRRGHVTLNAKLRCDGSILKQVVLSAPTTIRFKLIKMEISFPLP